MPGREAHQALPAELEVEPHEGLARPALVVEYPESDGEPMADNGFQELAIWRVRSALRLHFRHRADVLVESNRLVYFREGDPGASVAPDVFVVLNVPRYRRRWYKLWEEGRPPDFVLEVASPRTVGTDIKEKRHLYAAMGVREYFQFDPEPGGGLLTQRLQGRRLRGGRYEQLPERGWEGVEAAVRSAVLGLEFHFDGNDLRVWDPVRGRYLSAEDEEDRADTEERARQEAETRARNEERQRRAAETHVLELQEQLAALKAATKRRD